MKEKRCNSITLAVTDTDLVRLTALLEKLESEQIVPAPLTVSQLAYGLFVRGLCAADGKSKSFPSHSPSAEGKILRLKQPSSSLSHRERKQSA